MSVDSSKMNSSKPVVLVTGASGFIACHIVKQLLESKKYQVRGTVRGLTEANEKRVAPLRDLALSTGQELNLVEADLLNESSWTKAVEGCDYVLHTASPFVLVSNADEDKVVKPAVEGTLNVLKAVAAPGSKVKRVVLTSSMASVCYGHDSDILDTKVFNENDWTKPEGVDAYTKSKTLAEKAAWIFLENIPEGGHTFELSTINPSLVIGPPINSVQGTSAEIIKTLMMREMPFLPNVSLGVVDVRDVARAHIAAMETEEANGKRFVMTSRTLFFKELSDALTKEFGPMGYNPPSMVIPYFMAYPLSFFDDSLANMLPYWGKFLKHDHTRAETVLGIKFISMEQSLTEMVNKMIEVGYIPKQQQ